MIMDIKRSINDTRKGFEESFAAGEFYNRQTQDSDHLEKILGFVKISERMKILDLGTGSGYLSFVSYDGIDFPFESGSFDLVVTRYALHHFPDIVHSIGEVSRVLKNGGMLFISDPCPNECDTDRFVDDYMRLKKDGHIKFYTKDDWTDICCNQGLIILDSFESSIRFPKKKDTAFGYETVLMKHDKTVIDSYDLAETDTELYITERVNNILFMKE